MFRTIFSRRFLSPTIRRYTKSSTMALKAISAKDAASLDKDLMEIGGWSLDQLMELAGLSVSQAGKYLAAPELQDYSAGPGNNGGDGLVAARHLAQYGYNPSVYYPKQGKNELYQRLKVQLENLCVPFITDFEAELQKTDFLVDAIFGFSFGGPLRAPFGEIVSQIEKSSVPVLSVDAPSSWDIQAGPPKEGPGATFMPKALISLTAPKPACKKYGLDLPQYQGIDQILEVGVDAEGRL
ncbi:AI-BP family protein [Penicillium chermesinum]|nr:AI-BP family protein [Penicillium chermesinum]